MTILLSSPRTLSSCGSGDAGRELQDRARAAQARFAEARVILAIQQISTRSVDWDGCGSDAPADLACSQARSEIGRFISAAMSADLGWVHPHVSSNEYGEISFEWWNGEKKLTLYIAPTQVHYVCSWGPDINANMDAGLLGAGDFLQKWRWFRT